jgi:acyl-CoA thioester hydrolase
VKPEHCDVYGHVNNASYLTLFEEARWNLITANGYGLDTIKQTGLGPVILEAHVKYLKELGDGTPLEISTTLEHYEGKTGTLLQEMHRIDGEQPIKASSASFVFGLFDLESRRLVNPTSKWLEGIGAP